MSAGTLKAGFYAKFPRPGSLVVRLISEDLNPDHVYSVYFKTDGSISIYENYLTKHWLGNFHKEKLRIKASDFDDLLQHNTWIGLWVKARFLPEIGTTIQAGLISSSQTSVEWTDSSETALRNVAVAGFGTYEDVLVSADCYLS